MQCIYKKILFEFTLGKRVNDNAPTFENYNYGSGITVNDPIGKVVLTLKVSN